MRKLIYGINLTADGCCDHTKGIAGVEIHKYFTDLMHDVDLIVYGRKTYELMVPYWPDVAKTSQDQNQRMSLREYLMLYPKLFFPGHYKARMEIPGSFVKTWQMKF
jgi:hypothetical protein